MWFGTKDGLNRYDGYSFRIFKKESGNDNKIGNSYITTLYEDQNKLWVGTVNGLYIYDMEREIFRGLEAMTDDDTQIIYPINTITQDSDSIFWISTEGQGVFSYNEKNQELKQHMALDGSTNLSTVRNLNIDDSGTIWFSFGTRGLHFTNDKFTTIQSYELKNGGNAYSGEIISDMIFNEQGILYVLSNRSGFSRLNIERQEKTFLNENLLQDRTFLRKIIQASPGEFWIGSETGIYIYNEATSSITHLAHLDSDPYSLSDNAIHSLFMDRDEGIWIGSYFGGINYYPKQYSYFEKFYPTDENGLQGRRIREFVEDENGDIWIGTEDAGLHLYSTDEKRIRRMAENRIHSNIHGLCIDGNYLWIGTYSQGLFRMNIESGKIEHLLDISEKNIYTIHKDNLGDIWIGGGSSLHKYINTSERVESNPLFSGKHIRDIKEDRSGNIYIATDKDGLFVFDRQASEWVNFVHEEDVNGSLPLNNILSVFVDSNDSVWVTTQGGGFSLFNPVQGTFTQFTMQDGLANDVVYQALEDGKGNLWLSTNDGLSRFNTSTLNFTNFSYSDGLPSRQFNYSSSLKSSDGPFFFGTINGFITFDPTTLVKKENVYPVVLTDFLLFNKSISASDPDSPLDQSITLSDEITLSHNQNSFSLQFAVLGYDTPSLDNYYYRLEGADKTWISCAGTRLVNYSNLTHGTYTFQVKLMGDSVTNSNELTSLSLKINIRPPFWLSTVALVLYSILFILVLYFIYNFFKQRQRKKQKRQNELFKQKTERELYSMKIEFFIGIAHEIRTPLTLIKSPLDNIIKNEELGDETKEDLGVIHKNTNRLLELTNQLLDFQKMEVNSFNLNFRIYNVSQLVSDTILRFKSMMKLNNFTFTIHLPENSFYVPLDKESFKKIISNLLDNALKNAESYITIKLLPDESLHGEEYFDIVVENDGNIIPAEESEKIFQPFVQYNNHGTLKRGTGLGLTMSRSFAELHHGFLTLDKDRDCNRFRLTLPKKQEKVIQRLAAENTNADEERSVLDTHKENKPKILVVEDDGELAVYMSRFLSKYYNVITTSDGQKATNLLEKDYFDLIISDIMMPTMDGYELCTKLKSNIHTSHIPIILLTAKTGLQSRIEGVDSGADAFIEKPFANEFLISTINNLLKNKIKMIEALKQSPVLYSSSLNLSKTDEKLFKNIDELLQKNLNNPDFTLDDFANYLSISRSGLYRKIKGTFGMSPNEFIRVRRLKKAAELLLQDNNTRVNEVCYLVGFNSPSYFTKCFIKEFNVHPKDYHASIIQL